jgi:hypothetical protein
LLIVFEPGKASYYPEFFPNRYHPETKTLSNYHYFTRQCRNFGLDFLDFNAWFLAMKDTSAYPLFPKYGVHWSTYGMYLSADSLIKYIEKSCDIDLANIKFKNIKESNKIKDVDFDIELTLNLLFQLPHENMAYPEITIENKDVNVKPKVLTIADSYYWSIYNSNIPNQIFDKNDFWYYNKTIYPYMFGDNAIFIDHSKDKENIEKYNILLLMITELNLNQCFFGFTDKLYEIYHKEATENNGFK